MLVKFLSLVCLFKVGLLFCVLFLAFGTGVGNWR